MEIEDFDKPSDGFSHNYDNPYKILAIKIVTTHTQAEIKRMMSERAFFKRLVTIEIRDSIDINSPYVDCVEELLLRDNQKVYLRSAYEKLGEFFFNELDLSVLRKHIKSFCEKCHIKI